MLVIIGGGWAGLACAAALRRRTSEPICLFEAAPSLGGRARGLIWNDRTIDNGQHLTIGAYRQTFALLQAAGAPGWIRTPLNWCGVGRHAAIAQHWPVPSRAWPGRALWAGIPGFGPRGWPHAWRLSMARTLFALHRQGWMLPDVSRHGLANQSVGQWLAQQRVPLGLIEHFWQPFTEGALNTEVATARACTMIRVLRDSLAGPAGACDVLVPRRNLSMDGVEPIAAWLTDQGVRIELGHRVHAITPAAGGRWHVTVSANPATPPIAANAVVIALPFHASERLWADSALTPTAASRRWSQLEHRAITTIWIALTSEQENKLSHLPPWFVLNPVAGLPHCGQVAVRRAGTLGVVISAQKPHRPDQGREHIASQLALQLQQQLNLVYSPGDTKWITEKTATWACTVNAPLPTTDEQLGKTGLPGLFRCADDLVEHYPATIESAVRSAEATANEVMGFLSAR
jgi:predicted NAD/FAD-dependent oxidoreductase